MRSANLVAATLAPSALPRLSTHNGRRVYRRPHGRRDGNLVTRAELGGMSSPDEIWQNNHDPKPGQGNELFEGFTFAPIRESTVSREMTSR